MNDKIDLKISGASVMPGGEYNRVSISGSGKINGNVRCNSFHCSGSADVQGDLETMEMACSGACKLHGNVKAQSMKVSGAVKADGNLQGETLRISGGVKAGGSVYCGELRLSGGLTVGENVEAEQVCASGKMQVPGLLNADKIEISLAGSSQIGEIGGSEIFVRQEETHTGFWGWFCRAKTQPMLEVDTIEGDRIALKGVRAKVVRGTDVVLGENCFVGRVEYTGTLNAQQGTVGEAVKM